MYIVSVDVCMYMCMYIYICMYVCMYVQYVCTVYMYTQDLGLMGYCNAYLYTCVYSLFNHLI